MFAILLTALTVAAPTGQAPRLVIASVKDDQLVSVQEIQVTVPVRVQKKVVVNGQEQVVEATELKTETCKQESSWDLSTATASTAGGKKIDLDELKKRLAKPRAIVLSGDGKAIDAAYLKLFDADALVVVALPTPTKPAPVPRPKE